MSKRTDDVAKARITVVQNGVPLAVLSRKNAPGKSKHNQLEMLGGHLEAGESPVEGLVRELSEEERTGALSRIAKTGGVAFETRFVDRALHHLFELEITEEQYASIEASFGESLGFELVTLSDLASGRIDEQLTPRTRDILRVFGSVPDRGP
jgi:ADP-ribose pyrophosphatase YjhB (NUDIX family)